MNDDLPPRGRACMKSNDWLALAARRLLEILRAEDARRVTLAATEPDDEPLRVGVPITVAEVADITPPPPLWISRLQKAAEDGVAESLRASIREEGWAAYAQGGLDAMQALCDAIEGHPKGGIRFAVRLDNAWDNIGCSRGLWVA
jgi:hypothetical protein